MTQKSSNEPHRYELEKSPLFRLSNKKKLAELLGLDLPVVANLDKSGLAAQYNSFVDKKTLRHITEPIETLAKVHRRLMKLFV